MNVEIAHAPRYNAACREKFICRGITIRREVRGECWGCELERGRAAILRRGQISRSVRATGLRLELPIAERRRARCGRPGNAVRRRRGRASGMPRACQTGAPPGQRMPSSRMADSLQHTYARGTPDAVDANAFASTTSLVNTIQQCQRTFRVSDLQHVAFARDHFIQHRVHKKAEKQARNQARRRSRSRRVFACRSRCQWKAPRAAGRGKRPARSS